MDIYKPIRGSATPADLRNVQVCKRCGRTTQRQGKRNQKVYVCGSCRKADPWYVNRIGA